MNKKIVAFDVYDTLLQRTLYAPSDLFLYIEKKNNVKGFAHWRKTAELLLKLKLHREVLFDEIYENAPETYKSLKQEELDAEERFVKPMEDIKPIFEEYKQRGYKIVCISDMYLPSSFLMSLLEKNGYYGIDKVFVSCEYNKTKLFGKLYKKVCEELGIQLKELTYIGDNKLTDIFVPTQLGIKCRYYQASKKNYYKSCSYIKRFYKRHPDLAHSIIANIIATEGKKNTSLFSFGFNVAGPLILSYSMFVATECRKRGIDTALLLARDAYYIEKCLNIFCEWLNTAYIYAPRKQYYITHYDTDFRDEYTIPKGILSHYGINAVFKGLYIRTHREEMERLFSKERERLGYDEYLKNKIKDATSICIVEGTSGRRTSQKFVQKELGQAVPTFYIQCLPHIREKEIPSIKFLKFPKHYILNRVKRSHFIEKIFTSPNNSADLVDRNGVVQYSQGYKNDIYRKKKYQHLEQGMLKFFECVSEYKDILDIFKDNTVFEDILMSFSLYDKKNYRKIFKILKIDKWYLYNDNTDEQ